ncbi:MAG: S-layer homology domain-containing protein [Oscillospiraceae bacterium]|nr:S-layer homology domain-containing protein [Oscillospiraceae bacterium]
MHKLFKRGASAVLCLLMMMSLVSTALAVEEDTTIPMLDSNQLKSEWKVDQDYTLADPAPWNLSELKQVVDVKDPRSVAAYWVWAVCRLADNYDDGMAMMKYLFADIEPYGRGYTEGGMSGKAGWDTYFNERLKSPDYKWLVRAYFEGATKDNGMVPARPLTIELYYNNTNTETINAQSLEQLGRLNIVYWVQSHAGGNQVNLTVSKFDGSDRWYITSGTSSTALYYDQRSAMNSSQLAQAGSAQGDTSTQAEHNAKYNPAAANPFVDVKNGDYYYDAVLWAYGANPQVTKGIDDTHFGPTQTVTRGQCVTFLWRAKGCPEPSSTTNRFVDINSSEYWYKPILWAVEKNITKGVNDDHFNPYGTLSTKHIVTFLYRTMGIGPDGYDDGQAAIWANNNGLLSGTGLTVDAGVDCPRGGVVTILYRVLN